MSLSKQFIELDRTKHDRASFDCGEIELNVFLQNHAAKHMNAGISRTLVLPTVQPLINQKHAIGAFYTIAPSAIARDTLPNTLAKKLPKYPIPIFLLAQLAVHKEYQGQGLGKISLVHALKYLWQINQHMRAYAVVVDCLTDNAQAFYQQFGFELLCEHNGRLRLFLPMGTVGKLFAYEVGLSL